MSIRQLATDVRATSLQGAVGDWAGFGDFDRWCTLFNQSPQAVQVTTVTVTDPGDSTDVTITINGFDVTANTGTGADSAGVAVILAAAINADPRVRADVKASSSSTTLTLTGLTPGLAFTCTEDDGALSSVTTTQSATEAEAIPVGRAMISQGYQGSKKLGALAKSSLLTAQVITATVVNGVATTRPIRIWEVRGDERTLLADTVFAGSATEATEAAAIAAAANLALPANTVLAADSGADVTFTAEVAGLEFAVEIGQVTTGDITLAATTGPSPSTSISRAFAGVSMRPQDEECATIGGTDPQWPGNAGVRAATYGKLFVESDEAITAGAPVFVELGVTADNGQLFAADSATRLQLPKALAVWERDASDSMAVLRLNIP